MTRLLLSALLLLATGGLAQAQEEFAIDYCTSRQFAAAGYAADNLRILDPSPEVLARIRLDMIRHYQLQDIRALVSMTNYLLDQDLEVVSDAEAVRRAEPILALVEDGGPQNIEAFHRRLVERFPVADSLEVSDIEAVHRRINRVLDYRRTVPTMFLVLVEHNRFAGLIATSANGSGSHVLMQDEVAYLCYLDSIIGATPLPPGWRQLDLDIEADSRDGNWTERGDKNRVAAHLPEGRSIEIYELRGVLRARVDSVVDLENQRDLDSLYPWEWDCEGDYYDSRYKWAEKFVELAERDSTYDIMFFTSTVAAEFMHVAIDDVELVEFQRFWGAAHRVAERRRRAPSRYYAVVESTDKCRRVHAVVGLTTHGSTDDRVWTGADLRSLIASIDAIRVSNSNHFSILQSIALDLCDVRRIDD